MDGNLRNGGTVAVILVTTLCTWACGPAVGEVRMSMRPSRGPDCNLEIVQVSSTDMMPGAKFGPGGAYEMLGAVMIGADAGADPMSEEMRELVRPRACTMGGEIVSLMGSGAGANRRGHAQQNISFQVWGKRSAPAAPQKF